MTVPSRVGRPKQDEHREKLKMINFKADQEVLDALDALEAAVVVGRGVRVARKRSIVIRQLILAAAGKLKK